MLTPRPFLVSDRVRWADVDFVRIMRFSAFTRVVELAEQELMRAAGLSYATMFVAPTWYLPRRHFSIEYFMPVRIDDELDLVTFVSRLGETSVTLRVDVRSGAQWSLVAAAELVLVCVGVETWTKQRVPDDVREHLAPFVCRLEEARAWRPGRE